MTQKKEILELLDEYKAKYKERRLDLDEEESEVNDLYDVAACIDEAYSLVQGTDGISVDVEMCLELATHIVLELDKCALEEAKQL